MTIADDLIRLRRMVAEPTETTYTDAVLTTMLQGYPVSDSEQRLPDDAEWVATYDLHAAAADVWEEKAGALFTQHQFSVDGGSFATQQKYDHAVAQARYHAARRRPASRVVHGSMTVSSTDQFNVSVWDERNESPDA